MADSDRMKITVGHCVCGAVFSFTMLTHTPLTVGRRGQWSPYSHSRGARIKAKILDSMVSRPSPLRARDDPCKEINKDK